MLTVDPSIAAALIAGLAAVITATIAFYRSARIATERQEERYRSELEVAGRPTVRDAETVEAHVTVAGEATKQNVANAFEQGRLEGLADARDEYESRLAVVYHSQGLAQARVSFYVSLALVSLGFLVLLWGIWLAFRAGSEDQSLLAPTLTVAAGAIVEVAAATLMVIANQARKVMQGFFDRLRVDESALRDHEAALRLVDEIEDAAKRDDLRVHMAKALIAGEAQSKPEQG